MDYAGYFTPPVQQYSYYGLPATRPEHPFTPQEDQATDPMVRSLISLCLFHIALLFALSG